MSRARLIAGFTTLGVLTLAQIYIVNAILFCAWNTANVNDYHAYWKARAERWEIVSVLVELLWVGVGVILTRAGRKVGSGR